MNKNKIVINYLLPLKDLKQSLSDLKNAVFPIFWGTIDPRFKENRKNFVLFMLTLLLELAKSLFVSYITSSKRTQMDESLRKSDIDFYDSCLDYFKCVLVEIILNVAQDYLRNLIITRNKNGARKELAGFHDLIIDQYKSNQEVIKEYDKSDNMNYYASDISFKFITHMVRLAISICYLANFPKLEGEHSSFFQRFLHMPKAIFPIVLAYTFVTNVISNFLTKLLTHLDIEKKKSQIIFYEDRDALYYNKIRHITSGERENENARANSHIDRHSRNESNYELAKSLLSYNAQLNDAIGHIVSYLILNPYFQTKQILPNLAHTRAMSIHLKNFSHGLKILAGDELKYIERLKRNSGSIKETKIIAERQKGEFLPPDKRTSLFNGHFRHGFSKIIITLNDIILEQQISLKVRPGEIIKADAPSGFGKTSFLKAVSNFPIIPNSGTFEYACSKEQIAYIDQKQNFDRRFPSVCHFVLYGVKGAKTDGENREFKISGTFAEKALNILEKLYFTQDKLKILKENFKTNDISMTNLSGGEMKKLALANALLKEPKLILMDETLSGIDFPTRKKIMNFLKKYAQENNASIIFAEHEDERVEERAAENRFADRVINLQEYFKKSPNPKCLAETNQKESVVGRGI